MSAAAKIPHLMKKCVVQRLSQNFRSAVEFITTPVPQPGSSEILVKNRYLGINATDVNISAGRRYNSEGSLPFECGLEAIGQVVKLGQQCNASIQVGNPVAYIGMGAYAEYTVIPETSALPLPGLQPEYLSFVLSGLTASICLDKTGEIKAGEKILITAAAGGIGQIAVQWAKHAGCHVIGLCSKESKRDFLQNLGCDRVVLSTKEDLSSVLQNEYPDGIDVILESIGGQIFDTCVNSLAVNGRLVSIGYISGYETEKGFTPSQMPPLPTLLLPKSASLRTFIIFQFTRFYAEYLKKLTYLYQDGKMQAKADNGINSEKAPFKGLERIPDAVEYLFSRKSIGKVVVEVDKENGKP